MGLLFWIYFYYKTHVLAQPLFSNFSIISNALASDKEVTPDLGHTLDKNNILERIQSISLYKIDHLYKNKYFEILPRYDFSGFNLYFFIPQNDIEKSIEGLKQEWGGCVIHDPYIYTLSMALIKRQITLKNEKKYQRILDLAIPCKSKLPKNYSVLLSAILNKKQSEKITLPSAATKEDMETVEKINKITADRKQKFNYIYKFLELSQDYILKQSIASPSEIFEKYKNYEKVQTRSTYFERLSQIILSLQVKNSGWNSSNLEKFVALDPDFVIFEAPSLPFWNHIMRDLKIENFDVEAILMMIHDKVDGHFDFQLKPDIKKLFALSLLSLTHLNQDKIIEKESLNLSAAELKMFLHSPTLGKSFPGPWIYYLFSKEEKANLVFYIEELNSPSYKKYANEDNFWAVAPLLTAPDKWDDFNNTYIKKYLKNDDAYHRYLFIKLLSKEYFKRLLYLLDERGAWNRARFQIERDFYRDNLAKGIAVDFSIYKLYKIGDISPVNLWWTVL